MGAAASRLSRRRTRRPLLTLYVGAVFIAGAIGLALSARSWAELAVPAWQLALAVALALVLDLMVVPLPNGGGASASLALYFAGIVTLGPRPTAVLAVIVGLLSDGLLRRKPLVRVTFNAAHSVLSLLAAGCLFVLLGGRPGHLTAPQFPAAAVVTACLWLLEASWVAVAISLEQGETPGRRLKASLGDMLALDGALASAGMLLALLYQRRTEFMPGGLEGTVFLVIIALLPSALLYYAYRFQGHLQQAYAQSLQTLGALMEGKLEATGPGHAEKVAALSAELAEALALPSPLIEQIRYAGYLHDIGKVGVPALLLNRGRDVFAGESEQVKLHPVISAQITAPIRFLRPAAQMVQAHHERWDGLGYPRRLRQQEIPLGARILAVANAYVGMTSAAAPLSAAQALSRIHQAAGSRFDPAVADALAGLPRFRSMGPVLD